MGNLLKKIGSFLISMPFIVALLIVFAAASGTATFIENDHGAETSWGLVYGAKWFELIQILLGVGIVANIIRFRMFSLKKLPTLIFHTAFLFILIGAGITRYTGYEGLMHIREGDTENRMLSSDAFLQIDALKEGKKYHAEKNIYAAGLEEGDLDEKLEIGGKAVTVRFKEFIKKAAKTAVEDPTQGAVIAFVIPTPGGPEKFFLRKGEFVDVGPLAIYFDKAPDASRSYLSISEKEGRFTFVSNRDVNWLRMDDQQSGSAAAGNEDEFAKRHLYTVDGVQIATKAVLSHGTVKVISEDEYRASMKMDMQMKGEELSALIVEAEYDGQKREVALMGQGKRFKGFTENFRLGDADISLEWGAKQIELPFSLKLDDFAMEKYPGSMSPSSYESHVTLIDPAAGKNEPFRIFMNNPLEHGGYKFFQSSFDRDEMGTILSVNHDPGKTPTYLGYILLALGLFLNFFNPNSRFGKLARTRYDRTAASLMAVFAISALLLTAQPAHAYAGYEKDQEMDLPSVIETVKKMDYDYAENFGSLLVQDPGGRIKPMDSIAIDLVNKLSGQSTVMGLSHNQVIVGMASKPVLWQKIAMIKIKHPKIKELLGVSADKKYIAFTDVTDQSGQYKLASAVDEAIRKRPAERDELDKELIKLDEKLNIAYNIYTSDFMRIFPLEGDKAHTWYSPGNALKEFPQENVAQITQILQDNFVGMSEGFEKGDWSTANNALKKIIAYQKINGVEVYPSEFSVAAELFYNKAAVFERLIPLYLVAGLILLGLIFARLFKPTLNLATAQKIVLGVLVLGFIAHTANLALRWYISGHAPWSDGYESMVYISWTIILAGIMFARQSEFAVASTGILSGTALFVAHLSWLDPQITNLVPVLKSYWLSIHVSIITSSYGFLGLSALLGLISLVLFIMLGRVSNPETKRQIVISIRESTRISEMSMIIGLSLVTVGNFLGGVWANESWGRYWGWDPKETWALVTILVYAAVVHLRFIPKLNSVFSFTVASVVAYSSVIMTYFGVNYYLSGLHSYAAGDPVPVPVWVYYAVATVFVLIALASRNRHAVSGSLKNTNTAEG
ncbi:MAG: cytochrome c biogenesis protein CcsA [Sulfuricurvum sp.]|jgi:cytochrome c-type biogenesis protein CcsB|uniref:cytochrome c biogenesis protein CcsA n=1 Tax=Sulfuricurvum sp. TaxID=2025608 RepID=UPI0025F9B248|nr:cytochrome c biogenesis protein CcsA [Sulfuricurvum sp.]MCK9373187.1 cytochrome c biogenesis protein CcsA [Sulfuricurvum sp.]